MPRVYCSIGELTNVQQQHHAAIAVDGAAADERGSAEEPAEVFDHDLKLTLKRVDRPRELLGRRRRTERRHRLGSHVRPARQARGRGRPGEPWTRAAPALVRRQLSSVSTSVRLMRLDNVGDRDGVALVAEPGDQATHDTERHRQAS